MNEYNLNGAKKEKKENQANRTSQNQISESEFEESLELTTPDLIPFPIQQQGTTEEEDSIEHLFNTDPTNMNVDDSSQKMDSLSLSDEEQLAKHTADNQFRRKSSRRRSSSAPSSVTDGDSRAAFF